MKVLITGSKGFIGRVLAEKLQHYSNIKLYCENGTHFTECSLYDRRSLTETIFDVRPDIVFHLAGNPLIKANLHELMAANVKLTYDILDNMRGGRIIFASSVTVYGSSTNELMYEDSVTIPISAYGCSKLASEAMINASTINRQVKSTILRLIANVGSNPTHGVLKDLLHKYHSFERLELLGDFPGSIKPYIHVFDTVEAMIHTAFNEIDGTYNVSVDDTLRVLDIAEIIEAKFGLHRELVWLGEKANWKNDNKVVNINSDKLRATGWKPVYNTSKEAINAAITG